MARLIKRNDMPYTMHQRDRHHARQWRDSIAEQAAEREAVRDEARRVLGLRRRARADTMPIDSSTDADLARGVILAVPIALLLWAVIAAGLIWCFA